MFILRKIENKKDGVEVNFDLGSNYKLIRKDQSPERYKDLSGFVLMRESTYALIVNEDGSEVFSINGNEVTYIMMSNGQTFTHITE